jgi:methionine-S-sulfoxide reductase
LTFDPSIISYREILEIFFSTHDPTTLNRQGADWGPQYRSVIFYNNESQKHEAEKYILELEKKKIYKNPIVTAVEPFKNFYIAEEYHKYYYDLHKNQPYSREVIAPKIEKLKKTYPSKLKRKTDS